MYRSHTCGALRIADVNKEVTLSGWVQTIRKFGAITFVDLRDLTPAHYIVRVSDESHVAAYRIIKQ